MPCDGREVLLDATRLIAHRWTARQPTGIDRVCIAYLEHFRRRALAVVQWRGAVRVLDARHSERLFALLAGREAGFCRKLLALAPGALAHRAREGELAGMTYLNCGHSDFDLPAHHNWVARSGVRAVYFVHDLIPPLHPEFSRPYAVRRNLGRALGALRHGAGIVTPSQVVARDLTALAAREGIAAQPPLVAPIAGERFAASAPAKGEPYFLSVATIEPRKNHALLFQVWRELVDRLGAQTPKLVLVGQKGPMTGDILSPLQEPDIAAHVEWRAHCGDGELARLMGGARALLMPSRAEGFGLPLVEALAMGTPAIASDIPIFREVGQGAPLLLDPADSAAWADAIAAMATTPRPAPAPFDAPGWPAHFSRVEAWLSAPVLKSGAACETSLAA